jgi:peptide deformylase
MSNLAVRIAPDPILAAVASIVEEVDKSVQKLMKDMLVLMYKDNGVGLAAPQIGVSKRIIVIDLQSDDDENRPKGFYPIYMVNPEITEASKEVVEARESCLSVPEQNISVERHKTITVKFLDYNNREQVLTANGWLARTIQHENDHLNGIILIDYLSKLKKDVAIRRLKKIKKLYL